MIRRLAVAATLFVGIALLPSSEHVSGATSYQHLVGALHEHSGYSDGWPGTTPSTYYTKGRAGGLAFMGSGEHSDNSDIPVTASEGCLGDQLPSCVGTNTNSRQKWDATLEQATRLSTASFTGFRGFEWTSDRFGHINVYFSSNYTNAKADGGYVAMDTFWKWFTSPVGLGGGSDGIATFNHPGAKKSRRRRPRTELERLRVRP